MNNYIVEHTRSDFETIKGDYTITRGENIKQVAEKICSTLKANYDCDFYYNCIDDRQAKCGNNYGDEVTITYIG